MLVGVGVFPFGGCALEELERALGAGARCRDVRAVRGLHAVYAPQDFPGDAGLGGLGLDDLELFVQLGGRERHQVARPASSPRANTWAPAPISQPTSAETNSITPMIARRCQRGRPFPPPRKRGNSQ